MLNAPQIFFRTIAVVKERLGHCLSVQEPILHIKPGTVIGLDGDVVWMGMPDIASADLYVRPCYPELFRARMEYIKESNWDTGCMSVFTGTPGVFWNAETALMPKRSS